MSLKSLKNLSLLMVILSVVACGTKQHGMNIDGQYQEINSTYKGDILVDIKNNVETTYKFSADKKSVEIKKVQHHIEGSKSLGTSEVESFCPDNTPDISMKLTRTRNHLYTSGYDAKSKTTIRRQLKSIEPEKFAELTKDYRDGKLERVCVNDNAEVVMKIEENVPQKNETSQEAKSETAEDVKSEEELKSDAIPAAAPATAEEFESLEVK